MPQWGMANTVPDWAKESETETPDWAIEDESPKQGLGNLSPIPSPILGSGPKEFGELMMRSGIRPSIPESFNLRKDVSETISEPIRAAGKVLGAAYQDIGATLGAGAAGQFDQIANQGGNLYDIFTRASGDESMLPGQKVLADVSKTNPIAATAGKVGTGVFESVPLMAAIGVSGGGATPLIGKLIAAGFSADMISKAPELARQLGDEFGKPPGQRDMDKLTTLVSDAIQTGVFAPLAGAHAAGDFVESKVTPNKFTARQLAEKLNASDFSAGPTEPQPVRRMGIQMPGTIAGDVLATPERGRLADLAIKQRTGQQLFVPGETPAIEQLGRDELKLEPGKEPAVQAERAGGQPGPGGKVSFDAPAEAGGIPNARQSAIPEEALPEPPIKEATPKTEPVPEWAGHPFEKPGTETGQQIAEALGARYDGEQMGYKMFTLMDEAGKEGTTIMVKPGVGLEGARAKYEAKLKEYVDAKNPNPPRPPKSSEPEKGKGIAAELVSLEEKHKEGKASEGDTDRMDKLRQKSAAAQGNAEAIKAVMRDQSLSMSDKMSRISEIQKAAAEKAGTATGKESLQVGPEQHAKNLGLKFVGETDIGEGNKIWHFDREDGNGTFATEAGSTAEQIKAKSDETASKFSPKPGAIGSQLRAKLDREGSLGSEGGFINADILREVMDHGKKILTQGMEFGKWSAEMVKQLGKNSLRYLKSVWDSLNPGNKIAIKDAVDSWKANGMDVNFDFDQKTGLPKLPTAITQFIDNDIKPLLKKGVDATKAARDLIVNSFSPTSRTEGKNLDTLFEAKGYKDQLLFKANMAMNDARKMMGKLSESEQIAFVDQVKTGKKQPNPELQQVADLLREWDNKVYSEVAKFKPDLPYLENHLRVLWKVIPGSPEARGATAEGIMSKRPWQGSKGFLKKHTLDDMSEGIAAGGVPVTYNPVELSMLGHQDAMKFVAANRAFEGLKKIGSVVEVEKGEAPPPDYTRINDSIAKVYFKTPAGMIQKGEFWVEPNTARLINNYLSKDFIRQNALGRGLSDLKNATTAIELGMSPFHAIFESNEVIGSSIGLGLSKMFSGRVYEGARDIATAGYSPRETAKVGGAAVRYAADPEQFKAQFPDAHKWFTNQYPEADTLIKDLFSGGGKLEMHEDYRINAGQNFEKALKEGNYAGAVARAVPALNRKMMEPLFEKYIPRLKVGMFLRDYSFELERRAGDIEAGKTTREEIARKTWEFVDDRFGELNWDNLFWDRTFKSAMQLMFRSVTWKMGNIRGFGKAGADTVKELGVNWWKEGRAPRMTLPMGWLVGMSVVTAVQAAVITKAATGKYPWELAKDGAELARNLTFPRIEATDKSQRVSIPTYWRDAVHLAHSPSSYVKSSMTGEIGRAMDVWNNRDFYGTQVFNPDDPVSKKGLDVLEHMVPLPFGVSSYIASKGTGETPEKSAAGFLGFTKAPYYMSYSPAEQLVSELMRDRMPQGTRTREDFERSLKERKAIAAIKRGETTLKSAIADGAIERRRETVVKSKIKDTPIQYGVSRLDVKGAMKVWEKATPDERAEIKKIIISKIENSQSITDEEKRNYRKQIRESK